MSGSSMGCCPASASLRDRVFTPLKRRAGPQKRFSRLPLLHLTLIRCSVGLFRVLWARM